MKIHVGRRKHLEGGSEKDERQSVSTTGLKVKEFLKSSTLHGLKYIADDKITIFERSFFGVSFFLVILCSAFFISNIYTKWSASPIIITTSPKPTLTTSIPFPAVTICSLNQALKSRVKEINSLNYTLLMSLCDRDTEESQRIGQLTWKHFKVLLTGVSQPCPSMLSYCRFGSKEESCEKIFNPVLTDDGLCCTFNALDPSFLLRKYTDEERFDVDYEGEYVPIDWTPETGYSDHLPPKFFPRTAAGTGSKMGLTVILNVSSSEYYCSTSKSIGFKVLIHNPAEQPKIGSFGFLVTAGRENRVSIEPQYQTAAPAIRSMSTKVRQCLFSDEGDLSFYRTYSRRNCELECEARIFYENCDCILYYLPRTDPDSKICGPKDNFCTKHIQREIQSSSGNYSCSSCPSACFELNYNPTVTTTRMVEGDFMTNDDYPTKLLANVGDVAVVHFYYLSNVFSSTTKGEMFGFTEFLSNTGGLLGLFMGFSVFSVIEILYFILVRPIFDCKVREPRKEVAFERMKKAWMTPVKARKPIRSKNEWGSRHIVNIQNIERRDGVFPYLD